MEHFLFIVLFAIIFSMVCDVKGLEKNGVNLLRRKVRSSICTNTLVCENCFCQGGQCCEMQCCLCNCPGFENCNPICTAIPNSIYGQIQQPYIDLGATDYLNSGGQIINQGDPLLDSGVEGVGQMGGQMTGQGMTGQGMTGQGMTGQEMTGQMTGQGMTGQGQQVLQGGGQGGRQITSQGQQNSQGGSQGVRQM